VILKVLPKEEWTTIQDGTEEPVEPEEPGQYLIQVLDQKGIGIEDMKRVVNCSVLRYLVWHYQQDNLDEPLWIYANAQ
jgi:hypothetical protein